MMTNSAKYVLEKINERPDGLQQVELGRILGMYTSTAQYHIRKLERAGLIRVVRENHTVMVYPKGSV